MSQPHRYYDENHLHYLTTSTYRRARVFDSERFKRQFIATLRGLRTELGFRIVGYVLMPDYLRQAGTRPSSALALRARQPIANHAKAGGAHGAVHPENPAAESAARLVRKDAGSIHPAGDRSR